MTVGVDSADHLKTVVAGFEKANPGIKVNVIDGGSAYGDFMQTRIAAGTAPDVIRTFPGESNALGALALQKSGVLLDLSKQSWTNKLNASQKSLFGKGSKVYSVPMGATAIGIVYNEQALKEVGGSIPKTWDQVLDLCTLAKSKGKVAYAIFQKGGSVLTSYAMVAPLVYGPDPTFTQKQLDGTESFAKSGWVKAFDRQAEMLKAGCFNDGPNGTDYTAATQLVATKQALGVMAFTDVSGIAAAAPAGSTFTMAPQPVDNSGNNYLAVADADGFGINAKTKVPALAESFVEYLGSAAGQDLFANAVGGAPSLPDRSFKPSAATQKVLAEYINNKKTGTWPDQGWPNAKIPQVLLDGIQAIFNGTDTADGVAQKMDDAFAGK